MSCLSRDGCCSVCKEPLEQMIRNKVSQFNEGLLKNGCTESDGESSDSETEDDTATVGTVRQEMQMQSSTTPPDSGSRK